MEAELYIDIKIKLKIQAIFAIPNDICFYQSFFSSSDHIGMYTYLVRNNFRIPCNYFLIKNVSLYCVRFPDGMSTSGKNKLTSKTDCESSSRREQDQRSSLYLTYRTSICTLVVFIEFPKVEHRPKVKQQAKNKLFTCDV